MKSLFSADKAKQNVKIATDINLNYQRQFILDCIKKESSIGKTYLVLSFPNIKLFEEDYIFFEKLGYKITRETIVMNYLTFGLIRWD